MCGRFFLHAKPGDIIEHYNVPPPDLYTARYNIAPTTPVLALDRSGFDLYRWGLVPAWAKDISLGNRMFNARAETVAEKPSFRNAYRRRRCHIDQRLFSMAGIWEQWHDADGNELQSCAILTTEAKGRMRELHDRMPVYISPADYDTWLDCRSENTDAADRLLGETDPQYEFYAVDTAVGNSRNEGPELIKPLDS